LFELIEEGRRIAVPTLVLYEWLRGPRTPSELAIQEHLFPASAALPFESADAELSARFYRSVSRARTREIYIAIAASAIRHEAELWTSNPADFEDLPGLRLFDS
jgi:predicted nucleic acid-binding protein